METNSQGEPTQATTPLLLGSRYQILKQLGVGGFGTTFLAQDLHLPGHPQCVVKQLQPNVSSPAELQVARRLFETEATVLSQLGEYPQIPRLLAHFEEKAEFYLAQELIVGQDLEDELALGRLWSDSQAIAFLQDILGTLAFVHHHRVIHRDLKPANLIRRQHDNRIVLIDFGAVKQVTTQLGNGPSSLGHTISIGTQGYMPCEQVSGRPQFSSDVYAVGMIAIQGLTGRYPNTFGLHPQTGEIEWQAMAPQSQPALNALLSKMVRYDFRDRYADAASALAALNALLSNSKAGSNIAAGSNTAAGPNLGREQITPPMTAQTIAVGQVPPQSHSPQDRLPDNPAVAPQQSEAKKSNLLVPIVVGVGSVTVLAMGVLGWQRFPEWRGHLGEKEVPVVVVLSEESAIQSVRDFYAAINREDWETARSYFGTDLSKKFRPNFFQQFEQVTVEDLRVTSQNPNNIELEGLNTYFYPDGSLQREERAFTLQLVGQTPKIVASEFIAITQRRN